MTWRKLRRRMLTAGWVVLAAGILAGVWLATVRAVDRASDEATHRRLGDRVELAGGFAASVGRWLDAGHAEAAELARLLNTTSVSSAASVIDEFMDQRRAFARSALLVSDGRAVAASRDHSSLTGRTLVPCGRADASGAVTADGGLQDLVAGAGTGQVVVSPFFDSPWDCAPTVAAAQGTPGGIAVVFGDPADAAQRVLAGSELGDGVRLRVVDPAGASLRADGAIEPLPGYLDGLVGEPRTESRRIRRLPLGEGGSVEVIAAYAGTTENWGVVIDEDAASFDTEVQNEPALVVAGALSAAFAFAFVLLVLFDIRRHRAARRSELAKDAFFGIVGHELRTPLTVLQGTAETLAGRWDSLDKATRFQMAQSMPPQAHRLGQVVDRILTAANLHAGTHPRPVVSDVDLAPVVSGVVARFVGMAPLHEFEVEIASGAERVKADPDALQEVLEQLIDNAVKYSPSGGPVRITGARRRRRVEVAVEDEGVGLPSDAESLFEAFTQAEPVLRRVHAEGGVGVGLFIVRSLVGQMGGSVRARARRASGARFVVSLRPGRG